MESGRHKSVLLFLPLPPLSSVFNALSSVSSLLRAVLLSSPSQALPYSKDCDEEVNYTARERERAAQRTEKTQKKKKDTEKKRK